MVQIISIVNQKGGVGKTTTSINVSTAIAAIGKRVLVIDCDSQGNLSTGFNVSYESRNIKNIYNVFIGKKTMEMCIINNIIDYLDIIPSDIDLSAVEIEISNFKEREYILKKNINTIKYNFDYIVIDCPPSLGLVTINALTASDSVIIPSQCEFFALEGLSRLLKTITLIKKHLNKNLQINGIVLTMHDKRNKLNAQIEDEIRKYLGSKVYQTVIPRNVKLSESPSHGKPAVIYDVKCSGSRAYLNLTKEILEKENNLQKII